MPPKYSRLRERLLNLLCDTNVRKKHEFFDETVRFSEFFLFDIDWVGGFRAVKLDFYFRRGEVKCACFHSFFFELFREGIEKVDALCEIVLLISYWLKFVD